MNPELPVTPPPLPVCRSLLVTLAGLLVLLMGALLSIPSLYAILSFLTGSAGSKTFELSGFIIIILGPWICLATGLGLLRRWRWALYLLYAMLLWLIADNVWAIARGPRPERRYISESGVPTTELASEVSSMALPLAVIGALLLVVFLSRRIHAEFR